MNKKRTNPHKPFMVLNGILAFAVFAVVCLFLYLSFQLKRDADKVVNYKEKYRIEITGSLSGEDLSLYLNDSLLVNGTINPEGQQIEIERFAEENMLMVVDNSTETATPFNLSKEGGKVIIQKAADGISVKEDNLSAEIQ